MPHSLDPARLARAAHEKAREFLRGVTQALPCLWLGPGSRLLLAVIWRIGSARPSLWLRRDTNGSQSITLESLEGTKSRSDVDELLVHLPLLERYSRAGRPKDPKYLQAQRHSKATEAENLKARYPHLSWSAIAQDCQVPERTLRRWRVEARRQAIRVR